LPVLADQLPPDSHRASESHTVDPEGPLFAKQPVTPTLATTNVTMATMRRSLLVRVRWGFPGRG